MTILEGLQQQEELFKKLIETGTYNKNRFEGTLDKIQNEIKDLAA